MLIDSIGIKGLRYSMNVKGANFHFLLSYTIDGWCRYGAMRGCRWIDQVVEDVPYVTQLDVIDKYYVGE